MAALTRTDVTRRLPLGSNVVQTFRVTTGTASNATEWIATGFSNVLAVVGFAVKGTTAETGALASVTAPVTAVGTFTTSANGDQSNIANGETITIGAVVYTFRTALTAATAPVAATLAFTYTGVNDLTVTIDGIVYTSDADPDVDNTQPYFFNIEATAGAAAQGLADAINGGAGQGAEAAVVPAITSFGFGTSPHPSVFATVSGDVVTVTARVPGTGGNAIVLAENETNGSWAGGGTALAGGLDAVLAYSAENQVSLGIDDDATLTNLRDAINGSSTPGTDYSSNIQANADVTSVITAGGGAAAGTLALTARVPGTIANSIILTEAASGTADGSGTLGGTTAGVDAVASAVTELGVNFVLNAQGTGVAADTNLGDLGIECSQASKVVEVTVLARA